MQGDEMKSAHAGDSEELFLPSFCDVRLVFVVVVITELFAFVLALVSPGILDDPWGDLGLISLFLQWIALTSAAVLCVTRPFLTRFGAMAAALISYLLVLDIEVAQYQGRDHGTDVQVTYQENRVFVGFCVR